MINPDTAKAVKDAGETIVFLDVDFDTCYERICGDSNRPIASSSTKDELKERFDKRYVLYKNHSTIQIDACGSPMETAEAVRRSLC